MKYKNTKKVKIIKKRFYIVVERKILSKIILFLCGVIL